MPDLACAKTSGINSRTQQRRVFGHTREACGQSCPRHYSFRHSRTQWCVHQIHRETSGLRGTSHLSIKHSSTQRRVRAIEEKQGGTAVPDAPAPATKPSVHIGVCPKKRNERAQPYLLRQQQTVPCKTAFSRPWKR